MGVRDVCFTTSCFFISFMPCIRIPAFYVRGGTSKGVFFLARDLPPDPAERDRLLLRVIGSPDRFGTQMDGMGGATSSTSKLVILAPSSREDADVDYLFGAAPVDKPVIDWSGNCGNLSAAVGPVAICAGLVQVPDDGLATVRIWQANVGKLILAHVPMRDGEPEEVGSFQLDGVGFPGAEIELEFLDPGAGDARSGASALFPTGNPLDVLEVPTLGRIEATLIDAGNPTIFIAASSLGLAGTEMPVRINGDEAILAQAEAVRACAAVAMGLARSAVEATEKRPHTPKLAFVATPAAYQASDGRQVLAEEQDLLARIFSMGRLHHAMTGTGAVALAAAAEISETLPGRLIRAARPRQIRIAHPAGVLPVGAEIALRDGAWSVERVRMSRSARVLMEGWVRVPVP